MEGLGVEKGKTFADFVRKERLKKIYGDDIPESFYKNASGNYRTIVEGQDFTEYKDLIQNNN